MRRHSLPVFLLVSCVTLVGACGKKELPDLAIGVIAELTGDIPAVGASCKNAAEMAVAEINEAGGVKVAGKSAPTPDRRRGQQGERGAEAGAALKRLAAEDKVFAIVGPNASLGAIPAAQVAEEAKVPMITPWSTNPLTTAGKKWVFRACFTDAFEGHVLARFATGYLHASKAAVLYDPGSRGAEEPGRALPQGLRGVGRQGRRLRDLQDRRQGLHRPAHAHRGRQLPTSSSCRATTTRSRCRSSRRASSGSRCPSSAATTGAVRS